MEPPLAPSSPTVDPHQLPGLYSRIAYDTDLEARALESLVDLDYPGCRSSFGKLLGQLDFSSLDGNSGAVVQLLVDVLHKVNRRLYGSAGQEAQCHRHRMELIEAFAPVTSAAEARQRFMPALELLLLNRREPERAPHPQVERAKLHIDACYNGRLSLSRVAEVLAISPNYLSRLFRRETGMTLTAYIQRARLDQAKRLLTDSERSISEIAYQVGYQNYRDFYRNFVKYEKSSPREMRQKLTERNGS